MVPLLAYTLGRTSNLHPYSHYSPCTHPNRLARRERLLLMALFCRIALNFGDGAVGYSADVAALRAARSEKRGSERQREREQTRGPSHAQTAQTALNSSLLIITIHNRLKLRRRPPIPSLGLPPHMRRNTPLQRRILPHNLHRKRLVAPRDRTSEDTILEVIADRWTGEVVWAEGAAWGVRRAEARRERDERGHGVGEDGEG